MATKKASAKKMAGAVPAVKFPAKKAVPRSMPKAGKDPKGGLTAAGRAFFNKKEGSHLRPGVTGAADTPEKMKRKGSFLTRHFTNPRGPMIDEKGEPTRLALSAHAWGEPVPKTEAQGKKLAAKGRQLLEQFHAARDGGAEAGGKTPRKAASKKTAAKAPAKKAVAKAAAKRAVAKKAVAKKGASRRVG